MIENEVRKSNLDEMTILDFGCGKSYLTFVLYHYFVEIKKMKVKMIGLDLKEDVIKKCNEIAKKYVEEFMVPGAPAMIGFSSQILNPYFFEAVYRYSREKAGE